MVGDYRKIKTLNDFKNFIKDKSISVIGIARSNIALIDFLFKHGVEKITARDKKDIFINGKIPELEELEKKIKINYIFGENYLDDLREDIIFKTPAIRRDLPQFIDAQNNGSIITSEIELFFMLCPAKTIAVTGSAGKTTTTTIIGEILKADGKTVYVGGNIGSPLLNQIENITKEDYAVLELSSFQLFDLDNGNFAPNYAVITNITPNHLDWHKDMDEYINAKKIIFKNQKENDRLVLGDNNPDVYCDEKSIYADKKKIIDKSDIFIKGEYNIWNFMTAIGVVYDIADREAILKVAKNFNGVEHRMEFVCELGGIFYYNSSIDSTPTRTIEALNYFDEDKKTIVILGGSDKKITFDPLAPVVYKKAKAAILYGATKDIIKKCLDDYKNNNNDCEKLIINVAENFDSAVMIAKSLASSGDIVLLSPACASFGEFKDFEERGNRFKKLVKGF